jgi:hypothetical protein
VTSKTRAHKCATPSRDYPGSSLFFFGTRVIRLRARKGRRTVSGWCSADHIGPGDALKLRPRLRATWSHAPRKLSASIRGVLAGIQLWVALPETINQARRRGTGPAR